MKPYKKLINLKIIILNQTNNKSNDIKKYLFNKNF